MVAIPSEDYKQFETYNFIINQGTNHIFFEKFFAFRLLRKKLKQLLKILHTILINILTQNIYVVDKSDLKSIKDKKQRNTIQTRIITGLRTWGTPNDYK